MPSSRRYPERPIVGVGAVVIFSPGEAATFGWSPGLSTPAVLLVKRRFEPLAGQWSLPGGAVEVGETLEAAVAREINEETGVVVDVGPIVEVFDRILFDDNQRVEYHFVLVDYLCHPRRGQLQAGSDVSEVALADPNDLSAYSLTAKALDVIAAAVRRG